MMSLRIFRHTVQKAKFFSVLSSKRTYATNDVPLPSAPAPPKSGIDWSGMTFALTPTDYMFVAETNLGEDFKTGELRKYGPLSIYPSSTVLSYGQGIFEGIKAFRTEKGRVAIFRGDENGKRMNRGASQFVMPHIPLELYLHGLDLTVKANSHWIPPINQGALYLRPLLFGSGASLGVGPSPSYTWVVWASPVGSYFKAGNIVPVNLLCTADHHRAAPKGSGTVKAIGNYAPCFQAQKSAKMQGYNEVLFMDAKHERFVEEAGASNFFCVTKDGVLRTPVGAILAGVTRLSIIQLARESGLKVVEEELDIDVVLSSREAFCTGTGASITPVGSITHKGKKTIFNNGEVGPITQQLYKAIGDIQVERAPDKHGWLRNPWDPK